MFKHTKTVGNVLRAFQFNEVQITRKSREILCLCNYYGRRCIIDSGPGADVTRINTILII